MISFLLWLIYAGGVGAAYACARRHHGRVQSAFDACIWPADLGIVLAVRCRRIIDGKE